MHKSSGRAPAIKLDSSISAGRIILLSLLSIVTLGAALLWLPISCSRPITFFQAIFTSASTTCVTGLSVVPFHEFTFFGKLVLLALIQIGGLGFMTFSFFLTWQLVGGLGVAEKQMASEILNFERIGRMRNFLSSILIITFSFELIGALLLLPKMIKVFDPWRAIFFSIFYSVSAFCNAGITPNIGGLEVFSQDILTTFVLASLVIVGGIGFPVIYELSEKAFCHFGFIKKNGVCGKFSLHSKVVIYSSAILIVLGAASMWICQTDFMLQETTPLRSFIQVFFHSISLRSAGFHIQAMTSFSKATLFVSCLFMLIGASPGSTGGGLKTSTFVAVLAGILATLRGRSQATILGRAIPSSQITKSFAILSMGVAMIFVTTATLLVTDPKIKFFSLFFEAISAISTTGMSTGITSHLSMSGQIMLIIAMIAGRVGSLTFIFAFRKRPTKTPYKLPEERIFIG